MLFRKIREFMKKGLKKFDLFPTTQFIKFNKQSQYTTATGGFVSLALIIIILILFSSKGIQTLDRSIINSSVSMQIEAEPSPLQVVTSVDGGFMFAIALFGLNLNDPLITYFDISLVQNYYSPVFTIINSTEVPLVQCTSSHFAFNEEILKQFSKFTMENALCPPIGYSLNVGGRITSDIFSDFSILVKACNSTIKSNCANQSILQKIGQFNIGIPFINTIVNANDQKYLFQYMQYRNYYTFTLDYGVVIQAEIAQYEIDTDVSIMPYTKMITQFINTIPNLFTSRAIPVGSDLYVEIDFSKSSTSAVYTRSYSKLDDYFSYIGGLIGSALGLFLILKSYSEHSFLVELASKILLSNQNFSFESFNFLYYLGLMFKKLVESVKIRMNWQTGNFFMQSIEEMEEQLNICLLIKKVSFLQEAVSSILSEHQLDTLYLRDKRSLEAIRKWRLKQKIANALSNKSSQQRTDALSPKNQDIIGSQVFQSQDNVNEQQLMQKMRANVERVMNESRQNDLISQRILNRIDPVTFQRMGLIDAPSRSEAQQKYMLEMEMEMALNYPNKGKHSRNAVGNQYQLQFKNRKHKDIIIDNLQ